MAYTLLASQCPAPTYAAAAPSLAGCSDLVTTSPTLPAIDGTIIKQQLNKVFAAISGVGMAGGCGFAVLDGLGLSVVSGLTLAVASGHAIMTGIMELPNGGTKTLPDNTANVYLWITQAGTIEVTTSALPPPGAAALYLGNCVTSAGVISAIDYSGVVYSRMGRPYRFTNDRCIPSDVLDANTCVYTVTQSSVFEWNGNGSHKPVSMPIYQAALTGDLVLSAANPSLDTGRFFLNPNGTNRVVTLPVHPILDQSVEIINSATSGANTLAVKVGSTTICTLANGETTLPMLPRLGGSFSSASYPTASIAPA